MNKTQNFLLRLLTGFIGVLLLLFIGFAIVNPIIPRWGSTDTELQKTLPDDEIIQDVLVTWRHAITIEASPEEVWPWIIQIGDKRGGFYSYTFIENLIVGQDMYHNANQIMPEFQNPEPGTGMIEDILSIHEYEPGKWLLASTSADFIFDWTWLWYLEPTEDGNTRLLIHMNIGGDAEGMPTIAGHIANFGGFVMERNMMYGIKERAEGKTEPALIEALEIAIWFGALIPGLIAAFLYLTRKKWALPLSLGIDSIIILFVLTFAQPAIWLRLILVLALWAGLWWIMQTTKEK